MKELRISTYLLFLQGFFLLYFAYQTGYYTVYVLFALLNFFLASGLTRENRSAVKATLIYKGIDLFLSVLYLMAGDILSGISAAVDLVIVHDIIGYIQRVTPATEKDE
ncbi:hypothetical protein [Thermococcus sp.]